MDFFFLQLISQLTEFGDLIKCPGRTCLYHHNKIRASKFLCTAAVQAWCLQSRWAPPHRSASAGCWRAGGKSSRLLQVWEQGPKLLQIAKNRNKAQPESWIKKKERSDLRCGRVNNGTMATAQRESCGQAAAPHPRVTAHTFSLRAWKITIGKKATSRENGKFREKQVSRWPRELSPSAPLELGCAVSAASPWPGQLWMLGQHQEPGLATGLQPHGCGPRARGAGWAPGQALASRDGAGVGADTLWTAMAF